MKKPPNKDALKPVVVNGTGYDPHHPNHQVTVYQDDKEVASYNSADINKDNVNQLYIEQAKNTSEDQLGISVYSKYGSVATKSKPLFTEPTTLTLAVQHAAVQTKVRKVTFEIQNGYQFEAFYHDVIDSGNALTLVYDHSSPFQFFHFPPELVDKDTGEHIPLALLVYGETEKEPNVAYRVFSPGIRVPHLHYEYCVLLVDEKHDVGRSS